MGKFSTKLYYNGQGFKGSVATGILTVLITLFLISYGMIVFWNIVHRQNFSLDLKSMDITCLKAVSVNNTQESMLTDQYYEKESALNVQQVEITVAEYAEVM